eukprot:Ihof_evm7s147 gene=Ihof_evmTU7s147
MTLSTEERETEVAAATTSLTSTKISTKEREIIEQVKGNEVNEVTEQDMLYEEKDGCGESGQSVGPVEGIAGKIDETLSLSDYEDTNWAILVEQRKAVLNECNQEFGLTGDLRMVPYTGEEQLADIMALISRDLSEPYSIYTYRYFLIDWPHLSFLVKDKDTVVGCIICKRDFHQSSFRGYIAMLAVADKYRGKKLGTALAVTAIRSMMLEECDE